ncbi:MAG: hypothetical protein IPL18_15160 [Sphingomonadales bacterium]|nr:hypothetical protein [Sphingomonadales bacterium]
MGTLRRAEQLRRYQRKICKHRPVDPRQFPLLAKLGLDQRVHLFAAGVDARHHIVEKHAVRVGILCIFDFGT